MIGGDPAGEGRQPPGHLASPNGLQGLLGLQDGPWRWAAGIQAAIAIGLPLAAFTLTGYQSLGLIASLGAFTALYGSTFRLDDRLMLPLVGAGFAPPPLRRAVRGKRVAHRRLPGRGGRARLRRTKE